MKPTLLLLLKTIAASSLLTAAAAAQHATPSDLSIGVNKSTILENAAGVKRISVANSQVAEAVAVSKTEVLINGKAPGDTSLILWDVKGERTMFTVHVTLNDSKPDAVRAELQ